VLASVKHASRPFRGWPPSCSIAASRDKAGLVTLDRLLPRPHADKTELLTVLDRLDISLHINGSERNVRCHVIKRKISGGAHSDDGHDCRDAFLGLIHICTKIR
jgi:hypothetical protein